MLGRKDYTQEELANARALVSGQVAAYRELARSVSASADGKTATALGAFEPLFFNNLVLVLDRLFVHRIRAVSGKDGNPLNEVELITEALLDHNGVLRGNNVIKYRPEQSVTKLKVGDPIVLTEDQFTALADAFFADIERKFC
jgi:hypothetical protein